MNPAALSALAKGEDGNFMAASLPGGIEQQEKQGQLNLVKSQDIPIKMRGVTKEQLEGVGFVFGDPIDELFVKCQFPEGWSRAAAEHDMYSYILDAKGRKRFGVFYKAAFYDRRADIRPEARYRVWDYVEIGEEGAYAVEIRDCESVIERLGTFKSADYQAADALRFAGEKKLNEMYPDWRDPFAYWD